MFTNSNILSRSQILKHTSYSHSNVRLCVKLLLLTINNKCKNEMDSKNKKPNVVYQRVLMCFKCGKIISPKDLFCESCGYQHEAIDEEITPIRRIF